MCKYFRLINKQRWKIENPSNLGGDNSLVSLYITFWRPCWKRRGSEWCAVFQQLTNYDVVALLQNGVKKILKDNFFKVHIFWEGHKILWNLHRRFDWHYIGQIYGGDFAKFCGLLRIYEVYYSLPLFCNDWNCS